MRLINTSTHEIESFPRFAHPDIPPYAILSHRWGPDEVSLQEMQVSASHRSLSLVSRFGYQKILKCCEVAASFGFEHVWIDTCCIDKTNNVELTEAINSMFNYYRNAEVCYAYLMDVPDDEDPAAKGSQFRASEWFKRGWTLQELIAPDSLVFYDSGWEEIGTKFSLKNAIAEVTFIDPKAFLGIRDLKVDFSIAQKMSWASRRRTERTEDMAYCLMGIFGVNMPMIYGEGGRAFRRLQLEILKTSGDHSILAWSEPRATDYRYKCDHKEPHEFLAVKVPTPFQNI
ncbi:heterokaryon incompatibility protein-domain-containing protein [Cadophora sp. MPI-SDFR-AT-0126]|nr:heterokaryon incompatibility protein-domain-containing protein [Leotiomycetes sp. MPI-SDFR-AT-0126]